MSRIALASDHAGYALKALLADELRAAGHDVLDLGPESEASVDYPDFGRALGEAVAQGGAAKGIAVCGSGIGISIAVNRIAGARCALVTSGLMARLARQHNDANCIAMGARLVGIEMAKSCVATFLDTEFADAGDPAGRHQRRVGKLGKPPFLPVHIETHQ